MNICMIVILLLSLMMIVCQVEAAVVVLVMMTSLVSLVIVDIQCPGKSILTNVFEAGVIHARPCRNVKAEHLSKISIYLRFGGATLRQQNRHSNLHPKTVQGQKIQAW